MKPRKIIMRLSLLQTASKMVSRDNNLHNSKSELEEQLIQQHYGLVVSQALTFASDDRGALEDYIQVGLIGLLKAIRKYDEAKAKFSTFASVCIKNELINFSNRSLKRNKKVKIMYNTDLVSNLSENAKYYYLDKEHLFEIEHALLTKEQKLILKRKLENHSNREIAEEIGCSKGSLKNKFRQIIKLLRDAHVDE